MAVTVAFGGICARCALAAAILSRGLCVSVAATDPRDGLNNGTKRIDQKTSLGTDVT